MIMIVNEALEHFSARETLLDQCFGEDRHLKTCERLREGRSPVFAFVALDEHGTLVGTVRLWLVGDEAGKPSLLLGPLAVSANVRGLKIGDRLMRHALNQAAAFGHGSVVLVGDLAYYARFGFLSGKLDRAALPGPFERHRFLGLDLLSGRTSALRGELKAMEDTVATMPVDADMGARDFALAG
ncbi:GNAT family N-acetyltransferase [Roseibium sp.]|uniref:GNAT family N-acetyltransferase n=1 Tax=Roseibium sp. TaxID=1936156 RepID=UPI003BAB876D